MAWPQIRHLALMIGVCTLLTLLNPYGWRLYGELYTSLTDRFMIETLHEWQPVSLQSRAGATYVGYLAGLGLAALFLYRRIEPVRWIILVVFLSLSLRHWRNVLFFLLVSVPLWAELLAELTARVTACFPIVIRHSKRWLLAATLAAGLGVGILGPDHLERVVQSGGRPRSSSEEQSIPLKRCSGFTRIGTNSARGCTTTTDWADFCAGGCRKKRSSLTAACRPGGWGIEGSSTTTSP